MKRGAWLGAIVGGSGLVVAAVLGAGLLRGQEHESIEIAREPFVRRVPGSGELRSANNSAIGCPQIRRMWNFTITWMADEGKEVAEGEPILSFDGQQLQERLQVRSSRLETKRSELEKTHIEQQEAMEKLQLERAEVRANQVRLNQKLAVPESMQARVELEKLHLDDELVREEIRLIDLRIEAQQLHRDSSIRAAENEVAVLEREVELLRQYIAALDVAAPRGGFVVHSADWNDEKPKVGESVWAGRNLMQIADLSEMEMLAEVAERDAQFVREGQVVEIRLDASPDRVFKGRVKQLGKLFHTKSADVPTMVFDSVISIDSPDTELMRPGMAAGVEIIVPSEEKVIQIPESAVRMTENGPVVHVQRRGRYETVGVTLGPRWQGRVVIERGLQEGDRVAEHADAS